MHYFINVLIPCNNILQPLVHFAGTQQKNLKNLNKCQSNNTLTNARLFVNVQFSNEKIKLCKIWIYMQNPLYSALNFLDSSIG